MGKVTRNQHTAEFKTRMAPDAIRGEQALAEIGAMHGVPVTIVALWKKAGIGERSGSCQAPRKDRSVDGGTAFLAKAFGR
jgi:transposase-like protein